MTPLFDTNVVSEFRKSQPAAQLERWFEAHSEPGFISVLTVGEIEKGIARLGATRRAETISAWLDRLVTTTFAGRILPVDEPVARAWGELCGRNQRDGHVLPVVDSLLAATALAHDLTVITRNSRDFERCGVPVENPWGDPPA